MGWGLRLGLLVQMLLLPGRIEFRFFSPRRRHRRVPGGGKGWGGGVIDTPEIDGWQSVHEHTLMIYRLDDNLLISPGRCHLSGLSD